MPLASMPTGTQNKCSMFASAAPGTHVLKAARLGFYSEKGFAWRQVSRVLESKQHIT